jgi:hypothetical protein
VVVVMERKGSPGGGETKGTYSGEGASGSEISGLPFSLVCHSSAVMCHHSVLRSSIIPSNLFLFIFDEASVKFHSECSPVSAAIVRTPQ